MNKGTYAIEKDEEGDVGKMKDVEDKGDESDEDEAPPVPRSETPLEERWSRLQGQDEEVRVAPEPGKGGS